jgi:diacylglycerol kinase (ATP)
MKDEVWFIVLNPFAANGKTRRKKKFILQQLAKAEIKFQLTISGSREEARNIIHHAIEDGVRKFISVGGDGTFNALINGIFSQQKISPSNITIAIIPVGTGNDWIKTHGIPKSILKTIDVIRQGRTDFHDVGIVKKKTNGTTDQRYFINVAGFAFEGFVAERIEGKSKWLKMGGVAFIFGLIDALFKYRTTIVRIILSDGHHPEDDQHLEGKFFNISAGICKYAGGGMKLTPNAITNDGLFDITIVKNLSKWQVIKNVPGLFNGSFIVHPKVSQLRAKKFFISSFPPVPIETDGEVFGCGDAEVEILRNAIQVVIP